MNHFLCNSSLHAMHGSLHADCIISTQWEKVDVAFFSQNAERLISHKEEKWKRARREILLNNLGLCLHPARLMWLTSRNGRKMWNECIGITATMPRKQKRDDGKREK